MIRGLWTAASGMTGQQLYMDTIANNLANVNTTGYKKQMVDFQDLLYQTLRPAGIDERADSQNPVGVQVGHGVKVAAVRRIFGQGNIRETGNPLDLMINGEAGFFQVLTNRGTVAYTRDGSFKIDGTGQLVTSTGEFLEPAITVPQDALTVTIGRDGTVSITRQGAEEAPAQVGQVTIATFINPSGLKAVCDNMFVESAASGAPIITTPGQEGTGEILQGFLEMSNVKVVEEMVNMIIAQRAYEANSKSIQVNDEMLGIANNLRR